jgi:hypothetical protein
MESSIHSPSAASRLWRPGDWPTAGLDAVITAAEADDLAGLSELRAWVGRHCGAGRLAGRFHPQ